MKIWIMVVMVILITQGKVKAGCKFDPHCEDYKYKAKIVIKHKYPRVKVYEPPRKDGFHLREPMGQYNLKHYHGTFKVIDGEVYWREY